MSLLGTVGCDQFPFASPSSSHFSLSPALAAVLHELLQLGSFPRASGWSPLGSWAPSMFILLQMPAELFLTLFSSLLSCVFFPRLSLRYSHTTSYSLPENTDIEWNRMVADLNILNRKNMIRSMELSATECHHRLPSLNFQLVLLSIKFRNLCS